MLSKPNRKAKGSKGGSNLIYADRKFGSNRREEQAGRYVTMPKPYSPNFVETYTIRYTAGSSGNVDYSIADCINSRIFAATTVLGYSPFSAIRIKRVRMWAPITTIGTPVTIALTPRIVETSINCFGDIHSSIQDTTVDIDHPAFIEYIPEMDHPSGSWHFTSSTTTSLFRLFYPTGTLLEIKYQAIVNVTEGTKGFTSTLVGASVGGIYSRAVATNFTPVGVNTL